MFENSVYSILSPEGFASILYKDSSKSAEAADKMKITAKEVGDCSTFLFSNMSNAITGEVIHVDNGFSTVGV